MALEASMTSAKFFDSHDDEYLCVSTFIDDERQLLSDETQGGDVGDWMNFFPV